MEAPDHPDCSGPGHTCLGEIDLGIDNVHPDRPMVNDFSLFAESFEGVVLMGISPQNDEDLPEGRLV